MKHSRTHLIVLACLVWPFSGCTTLMTQDDCASADWSALGKLDGRSGSEDEVAETRFSVCEKYGFSPQKNSYFETRNIARKQQFCSFQSVYWIGLLKEDFPLVCEDYATPKILASFDTGREQSDILWRAKEVEMDIESSQEDINRMKTLKAFLREDADDDLSDAIDDLKHDIIPSLEADMIRFSTNFEAFDRKAAYEIHLKKRREAAHVSIQDIPTDPSPD